jgi:DNA relaxase NicK
MSESDFNRGRTVYMGRRKKKVYVLRFYEGGVL